jgi:hypothetical protein
LVPDSLISTPVAGPFLQEATGRSHPPGQRAPVALPALLALLALLAQPAQPAPVARRC